MASSVDLPMPEPAKMPMRWPAQSGVKRSMTRTPVFSGVRTRWRRIAGGGSRSVEHGALALQQRGGRRRSAHRAR